MEGYPPTGAGSRTDRARTSTWLDRSWRAAQDAIEELASVGIVRQLSAGKGNRLYEAPQVFALLDGFEHQPERLAALGAAPRGTSGDPGS